MDRSTRFWDRQATSFDREDNAKDETWLRTVANAQKRLKESDIVLDYGCAEGLPFLHAVLYPLVKLGILPPMRFFEVKELEDLAVNGGFQIMETERLSRGLAPLHFIVAKKG